jgi:hypothetical protein
MNENDLIPPRTIREWCEDPAYVEAVSEGSEQQLERPLDVEALLVGIRFLHSFVKTREGERAVQRALAEGFVQVVPGGGDDTKVYAIPRLLWRDDFYDNLCPAKGKHGSIGIQIARYMLWGPPDLLDKYEGRWQAPIRETINRFEAEQNQRRKRLAKTIRWAAGKLAVRSEPSYRRDDGMVAINSVEIFELVRLRIPDVTQAELDETIMQILPYVGPRH